MPSLEIKNNMLEESNNGMDSLYLTLTLTNY